MEIRKKLTYQFTIIVAIILILAELSIFIFSKFIWREDFTNRLFNKAMDMARLLIDVEGVDANVLMLIESNNLSTLPLEEIHMYNNRKEVLFSSKDTSSLLINPDMIELVSTRKKVQFKQGEYTMVGFLYSGKHDQIIVIAGAVDIYGMRKLNNLLNTLLVVFLVSLIILFFSGKLFAHRALKPILKVIDEVPSITESSLHIRVNEGNGKDEIARLAKTFNRMLDRLESAFKIQRNFIANASHELRTPFSSIIGQLDVALLKNRESYEYQATLKSVLKDMNNLARTSNNLILLAMASSDPDYITMDPVRMDDILWDSRSEIMKMDHNNKVIITFTDSGLDENLLSVYGNNQLLKVAFMNLMDNGCKYSADHTVMVDIAVSNHILLIKLFDEGIGIPVEEQGSIFEPFHRAKNAAGYQGSGLGLSLVKRIILLHNGTISVTSVPESGTEFVIALPVIN